MDALRHQLNRRSQAFLDRLAPHTIGRWLASVLVVAVYVWRVSRLHGFYIVTYGLGIYNLNLLIGFLTPQTDPDSDEPALPTKSDEEFKPFVRRLPEFKFWNAFTRSFIIAFFMTFLSIFDVPVFWPILLMYWLLLFAATMKRQIKHMIKYRYIPFSFGKRRYDKNARSSK
eukprot:jgi/Pico_ML_1/51703/g273.t1